MTLPLLLGTVAHQRYVALAREFLYQPQREFLAVVLDGAVARIDAATFQEIAERADLTRPAINHYFKSKQLLYQEVVETTNAKVSSSAQRALESESLLGQLSVFIDAATRFDAEGNLTDEATKRFIRQLLENLVAWTRRLQPSP
jgi:AcrR family transcriptional regulator